VTEGPQFKVPLDPRKKEAVSKALQFKIAGNTVSRDLLNINHDFLFVLTPSRQKITFESASDLYGSFV